MGFDVVFAEPDESLAWEALKQPAQGDLNCDQVGFTDGFESIAIHTDYDAAFARSLQKRPVVLGYYFTSDRDGRTNGVLPRPVMAKESLLGRPIKVHELERLSAPNIDRPWPAAGYFNSITEGDGVVRSHSAAGRTSGQYYESLALAMFRMLVGQPRWCRAFPRDRFFKEATRAWKVLLKQGSKTLAVPVDDRGGAGAPLAGFLPATFGGRHPGNGLGGC